MKRILSILLIAIILVSFVACGNKNNTEDTTKPNDSQNNTTSSTQEESTDSSNPSDAPTEPNEPSQTTPGTNKVTGTVDLGKAEKAQYETQDQFAKFSDLDSKIQGHVTDVYSEGQDYVIAGGYLWKAHNWAYDEEEFEWRAVCKVDDMKIVFGHYYCVVLSDKDGNLTAMCGPDNEVSLDINLKLNEIKGHIFALNADASIFFFIERDGKIYCQEYKLSGEISDLKPISVKTNDGKVFEATDFMMGTRNYAVKANGNIYVGENLYLKDLQAKEVVLKLTDRAPIEQMNILTYNISYELCYKNKSDKYIYLVETKSNGLLEPETTQLIKINLPHNYTVDDIAMFKDSVLVGLVQFKDGRYYRFFYNEYSFKESDPSTVFADYIELNELYSDGKVLDVDVLGSSIVAVFDDGYVYKILNGRYGN